jgi:hypothetical protein
MLNPMSKSNVNPNHYKVAGRERQGEDILQQRHKQKLAETLARERFEPRLPNPAYTGPGRDESGPEAPAGPLPESSANEVPPPTNLTARKKRAPTPATRRAPIKAQASAKAKKRATAQKRASSRNDVKSRPTVRATAGAQRKKPSTGRRGKR